ncbi:MAG: transglycosylase SLT domain-containing protein, partial [Chloroflexota bacterium]
IRSLKPDTPLLKKLRRREIEIGTKTDTGEIGVMLKEFVDDYPGELDMKLLYARHLERQGNHDAARRLFREIYVTASPLSEVAAHELTPAGISTQDLVVRGKNLNAAFLFSDAEQCFRAALHKGIVDSRTDIEQGLARSLFGQKRYREAAELYKKGRSPHWYARSLLRARQIETFEAELPSLRQHRDSRLAPVFIAYGNVKRREGDTKKALSVFRDVSARYPAAREDAIWAIGWMQYRSGNYKAALRTFSDLYKRHGDTRYRYWVNKCRQRLDEEVTHSSAQEGDVSHRDFYGFLSLLSRGGSLPAVAKASESREETLPPRISILIALGLTDDAASELLSLSRKGKTAEQLRSVSLELQRLGKFNSAISVISRTRYDEENHRLFYPHGYWKEVESASRRAKADPLLVLSVIREESKFDPHARSAAGAVGLMQLMPKTGERIGRDLDIDLRNPARLIEPGSNVLAGAYYLSQLLSSFNSVPVALAAYNAGEEIVREWLSKGNYGGADDFIEDIPYDETRNYVKRVIATYMEYLRSAGRTDSSAARRLILNL